ncbi:TPA: hypothetical protein ACW96C_004395 [Yersinia enterocolitica]
MAKILIGSQRETAIEFLASIWRGVHGKHPEKALWWIFLKK